MLDVRPGLRFKMLWERFMTTFLDDFNRADGVPGNGWVESSVTDALSIKGGSLTLSGTSSAGIHRTFNTNVPTTISADVTEMNGFGGLLKRYSTYFLFGSDGGFNSGYGIAISRGDQNFNDSKVLLVFNGVAVDTANSTFQFGAAIHVAATFSPNGSLSGSITGDGSTFNFAFPPRPLTLSGSEFVILQGGVDTRSPFIVKPTIDNITIAQNTTVMGVIGGQILQTAIDNHLGDIWGKLNCTGFVYTISAEVQHPFFDSRPETSSKVGSNGGGTTLLNDVAPPAPDPNEWNFLVPIRDIANGGTSRPDPKDDDYTLIANDGHNFTKSGFRGFQPGDLFRGEVVNSHGTHIMHAGVVAGYDEVSNKMWLVDNFNHNGNNQAFIAYTGFSVDPLAGGRHLRNL